MSTLIHWTDDQVGLLKSTIAPGCSDNELRLFAYACQRTGLDPFSKQIYAIKRGGKMTIQVSIDGLRSVAERTGELGGSRRYWCGMDGEWKDVWLSKQPPAAAKCEIWRKGCDHPFVGVATFSDYNAGMGLWNKMPSVMLAKCAEAQALRAGFPADLSGLYSSEEMDQADIEPAPAKPATVVITKAEESGFYEMGKKAIQQASTAKQCEALQARLAERFKANDLTEEEHDKLQVLLMEREEGLTK